jgi:putative two-component system response regulator
MEEATKLELERLRVEISKRRRLSAASSHDFFLRSLEWIASMKTSAHIETRMQCLEDCSKYFYHVSDRSAMLRAVSTFHALALRSGAKLWIRKAQTFCGIAYADAGDLYQALTFYGQALRTARELDRLTDEAYVFQNMGTALMFAGLYTDAMRAFQRAYELATAEKRLLRLASSAATNMAEVCYRQGQYDLGIRHIQRALELGFSPSTPEERDLHDAIVESNYVQLAVGVGDPRLADMRLSLCEAIAIRAPRQRIIWVAKVSRGLCELDHGDARKGIAILEDVVENMHGPTDSWVDAHIFLIRGLEKLGQAEQALAYANQLAAALTQLSQRGMQAIVEGDVLPALTLQRDLLHALELQRTRLETVIAKRAAARATWEAIERLAMTAQFKDDSSGLHGHRVGSLSRLFAEHLGLRREVIERLEVAGRLHDIGKMAIPDQVLRSGSAPSAAERELLNAHAKIGADLLAQSAIPELQCAEIVARHHHERWDGEGYPSKMKGKRIPAECRIVAIVDCFDAMTHGRPYVRPVAATVALGEIQVQKGKQFDPELADAFTGFMQQLLADHPDVSRFLEQSARKSPLTDAMRELGDLLAAVSEEKHERPALGAPPPPARPRRAPSPRSPEPL